MAKMLPDKPGEIPENSNEDIMFEALKDLPDDYYVFHSFNTVTVENNTIKESETDFIIFHPEKGMLFVEAKNGYPSYENNTWYYGSGVEMKHGGPFQQAQANKYRHINLLKDAGYGEIVSRCKFLHAVWFPSVPEIELNNKSLPQECDKALIMTAEALDDPEKYIDRIFNINVHNVETNLNERDVNIILKRDLCPEFHLAATNYSETNYKNMVYKRLLKEQINVLNYLDEQKTAIINGAAGTGKTFIALEQARRCTLKGEKVLFLCFNTLLRDYLTETYDNEDIHFYSIGTFANDICGTTKPDFKLLKQKLDEHYYNGTFPYKHIVIDEGQDFGREELEEAEIIEYLETIVEDHLDGNGTFYIFYDKNQMINSKSIPSYLADADCKLTLYKNCRNTREIATTSSRVLKEGYKINLAYDFADSNKPRLYMGRGKNDLVKALDSALKTLKENYKDIVIITCKTLESYGRNSRVSEFAPLVMNDKYKGVKFVTCRRFKGLEADAVILVDVDKEVLINNPLLFYTGTSRAKFDLSIVADLDRDDCAEILNHYNFPKSARDPITLFASKINVDVCEY